MSTTTTTRVLTTGRTLNAVSNEMEGVRRRKRREEFVREQRSDKAVAEPKNELEEERLFSSHNKNLTNQEKHVVDPRQPKKQG